MSDSACIFLFFGAWQFCMNMSIMSQMLTIDQSKMKNTYTKPCPIILHYGDYHGFCGTEEKKIYSEQMKINHQVRSMCFVFLCVWTVHTIKSFEIHIEHIDHWAHIHICLFHVYTYFKQKIIRNFVKALLSINSIQINSSYTHHKFVIFCGHREKSWFEKFK